jgi:WD40 repeat protein
MRARGRGASWQWTGSGLLLLGCTCDAATPPAFPSEPSPRVEVTTHTGYIKKLSVAPRGDYFVTVSDDKTARVWSIATGRLLHVLRVPLAAGHEGRLYAAAVAPAGDWLVVGGFTGLGVGQGAVIYAFDSVQGRLLGAVTNLGPAAVENLVFSPDGKVLAICLADGAGVLFYDWPNQRVISRATEPRDKILGAAAGPNGDFAITTLDGILWLYAAAAGFNNPRHVELAGTAPMHVQFSPDGRHLAVGFDARAAVAVVDVASLRTERILELPAAERQAGQHVVDWSADGRWLYSGGQPADPNDARIYRWPADGSSPPQRVLTASRRISDLRRLSVGGFAFSSGAPEVGLVDGSHRLAWLKTSSTVDPGLRADDFRVSRDGSRISFAASPSEQAFVFDLNQRPDTALAVANDQSGSRRRPQAPGWSLATARDGADFSVQGRPIELDHAERVRTWTLTSDDRHLLVGTAWSLRLLDRAGQLVWRADSPEDTRTVVATEDGRFAVAAFADGTIRWYRMDDGVEVLAFLPHRNSVDWVAWIPSGYYTSSVNGDNLIGWHLNNGLDQTPDFYRAIQFERVLYRPDVVRDFFQTGGRTDVRSILRDAQAFRIDDLRMMAPPRLAVAALSVQVSADRGAVARFTLSGSSRSLPMLDYTVFVNDIPVTPWRDRVLSSAEARTFERAIEVPLPSAVNDIRVEASNGQSMGITETFAILPTNTPPRTRGDLYLVSIGASNFQDPGIRDLGFAARDADVLAEFFAGTEERLFNSVHVRRATDTAQTTPTRNVVVELLSGIRDAGPSDTVIVFLASHGFSDRAGNFYFVPTDGRLTDYQALQAGEADAGSFVPWRVFFDEMRRAAGNRILIVDTCSSDAMRGTFDAHTLAKRSAASRFALVAASRADEESQEFPAGGHGIFTFGLLEALRTGADDDGDGRTSLREAFDHAYQVVQARRPLKWKPQTPQFEAPAVIAGLPLVAAPQAPAPASGGLH